MRRACGFALFTAILTGDEGLAQTRKFACLALTARVATAASTPALASFDPKSEEGRWTLRKP